VRHVGQLLDGVARGLPGVVHGFLPGRIGLAPITVARTATCTGSSAPGPGGTSTGPSTAGTSTGPGASTSSSTVTGT
jgi:hypothetical protein